jgi:hypothetical protein
MLKEIRALIKPYPVSTPARAAGVRAVRQPQRRHGGERTQAVPARRLRAQRVSDCLVAVLQEELTSCASSPAAASNLPESAPVMMTRAPSSRNSFAAFSPIPDVPPVIRATLFESLMIILLIELFLR